jgi:hypothetical protein
VQLAPEKIHERQNLKAFFAIILLINFCPSCALRLLAQNRNFSGIASSLSVSDELNKKLDLNILATSKSRLGNKKIKGVFYSPQTIDIYAQALVSYKIDKHWRLGAGYGFQRNNPFLDNWRNEHRLVQQVNYFLRIKPWMFYSRLRVEERWFSFPNSPQRFSTRIRCQTGFAVPFSEDLYWQLYEEAYFSPSRYTAALFSENWAYTGIGIGTKSVGHFEAGLGYNSVALDSKGNFTNYLLFQAGWNCLIRSHDKKKMSPVIHNMNF